jgi:hypothetical protein
MTNDEIKKAREIIAAAERGETLCIPVGKVARTGWSKALDEVERLQKINDELFKVTPSEENLYSEILKLRAVVAAWKDGTNEDLYVALKNLDDQ